MTGARRVAILAALAALSAACEALVGITDRSVAPGLDGSIESGGGNDDGSSSAAADTGASDVGVAPHDTGADAPSAAGDGGGANVDAAVDGDASPSLPPPDASADAGDGGDAGDALVAADTGDAAPTDPDVPCAQQPANAFCDDFDTSASVGQNWDYLYVMGDGGSANLDTVTWVSSPKSAQIILPPISGMVTEAQLGKTIVSFPSGVRLAFDYRVDSASFAGFPQTAVAQLYLNSGSSAQTQINFVVGTGASSQLQAYVPSLDGGLFAALPTPTLATWSRVVLSYTTDGALTVFEDGHLVGSLVIGTGPAGTVEVIAGAPYVNATGTETVTLEIDNVVVRAQ